MMRTFSLVRLLAAPALVALTSLAATAQTAPVPVDTMTAQPAISAMPKVGTIKPLPIADHYEGGQQAMYELLAKNLVYPPLARRNRMQGACIIDFTLNADGSISEPKVVKEVGGGTGQEALRLVKMLKFKPPGYANKFSIPVNFKL